MINLMQGGTGTGKEIRVSSRNPERIWVVLILIGALIFRLRDLGFLLPYYYYSDEQDVAQIALRMLQTGDLNPHYFWYGSFPIYWTTMLDGLVLGVRCWLSGGINTIGECIRNFGVYDQGFLLFYLGRATSLLFGLGTIYLTFLLGKRVFNRAAGYLSAIFLAISPFHIFFSQVFKVDISLLFWILLTVYFSLNIYEGGGLKNYLGAGLGAGLALSTKYEFLVILPILLAVILRGGWKGVFSWSPVFSAYLALLIFILTCPFSVLSSPEFFQQLKILAIGEQSVANFRVAASGFFSLRFVYELLLIFPFFFGPLVYLCALPGLWESGRTDFRKLLIIISFPLSYLVFSGWFSKLVILQYELPYFPFIVILGSGGMVSLWRQSGRRRILGLACLVASLCFFLSDLAIPHFKEHFQVYREAGDWINREIPKNKKVMTYFWQYPSTRHFGFEPEINMVKVTDVSIPKVRESFPDYLILTDSHIFREPRCPCHFEGYLDLLERLSQKNFEGYQLAREFRPSRFWEWFAGRVYPEMKDFRIRVFSRAPGENGENR